MKPISIILALVLVAAPSIAFAQDTAQITLLTNKQSYVTGDTISLSGKISSLGTANSAVLQIFNSFNVLIQIGTINVAPDGTFSKTITAEGQSWENDGTYQIKVIYVSTPILATATVNVNFKATPAQSTTQTVTPTPVTQPSSTSQPASQVPSTPPPIVQSSPTPSPQNTTQTTADTDTSVDEQIKQRIALANKLKQQIDRSAATQIPFWVKDNARKWHDGTINNDEFSKEIQYFVSTGLVKVNGSITPTYTFDSVPSWQKDVAEWWSQGTVSDYDYVNSIQYLLDKKIIK